MTSCRKALNVGLVLAASGTSFCACTGPDAARAAEAARANTVSVSLAPVERGQFVRTLHAAGTLRMKAETELAFKMGGVITRVAADVGSNVRKGQPLAWINPVEARAMRSQAEQLLAKANRDFARARSLLATGALAMADLQNAQTELTMARATADAARFNERHTVLVSPDNGVIDRRMCEVGEIAAPGRPMFHLNGRARGAVVRVALTDRDALALHLGDRARIRLDAKPEPALLASVSQIASVAQQTTGTVDVELTIDDPGAVAALPSGLTAKVEISRVEQPPASVPVSALVDGDGDDAAVFVVEKERARRMPVQVRFWSGDRVALAADLTDRAMVVSRGAGRLSDGARVRVVP